MNVGEWVIAIAEGVEAEAGRESHRYGPTPYDGLIRQVQARSTAGEGARIVNALLRVARGGHDRDESWWQRLLNLLQHVPAADAALAAAPARDLLRVSASPVVRAYVLQRLVAAGAAIDWDNVETSSEFQAMPIAAPLVVADAMIRGRRQHSASLVLEEAISSGVLTPEDMDRQYARWESLGLPLPEKPEIENNRIDLSFLDANFFPPSRWQPVTELAMAA